MQFHIPHFSAFSRRIFHPRPQEGVFRCDFNKLTQDLFKITKIENERVVMLEDEKGLVRIWFPKQHLGSFFEEVKGR